MTTAHETLAAQVAALQAGMASRLPAELGAVFTTEQAGLRAGGAPSELLDVGSAMPDAELLDGTGKPTSVRAVAGGRPTVVVFYRGAWCPYCNLTLRVYQQQLAPELDRRGIALIAISPQKPDGSLVVRQTHALTYPVVSDPGNRIATALGILTAPSREVRNAQSALGLDLTAVNADATTALPMPTVVLLDQAGRIRWIDVHPDYSTRTEPADVLAAADQHLS